MAFRDLAADIADDFADAAEGHREFFGEGFSVTARRYFTPPNPPKHLPLPPRSVPIPCRRDATPRAVPLAELVGTTWGDEASLEAAQRRRAGR